ncbi:MAG: ABC transporter permease subunit [Micromonosporaceae bacterium]|jgi:ABC-2 type transport system permease protein
MLRNVFLKNLRDQRRGLVGWSVGIVLLILLMSALWPSFGDIADLEAFLRNYPEAMREIFNLDEFTTGRGYLNAEIYSALLPVLFLVYAIGRGARLIAGEEQAGTLDLLLMTRVSRVGLVLQQAAAVAAGTLVLGLVLMVAVVACSPVFDLGITVGDAATGSLAMVLLGVEFGWLALAVGAVTGRRVLAVAVPAALAVAAYLLYVAGRLVEAVEPWLPVSPFHQALEGGPLGAGLPAAYVWMPLAGAVAVAASLPVFHRRDVGVHR